MAITLGIDPGTSRIGYGVIEDLGVRLRPLAWGVLTPQSEANSPAAKQEIRSALNALIAKWKPEAAAVERLFFMSANRRSAMAVAEMRGIIMVTLADKKINIAEFTPLEVKQRICGNGRAAKNQVADMTRLILNIKTRITPDDASDALAIALCAAAIPSKRRGL